MTFGYVELITPANAKLSVKFLTPMPLLFWNFRPEDEQLVNFTLLQKLSSESIDYVNRFSSKGGKAGVRGVLRVNEVPLASQLLKVTFVPLVISIPVISDEPKNAADSWIRNRYIGIIKLARFKS